MEWALLVILLLSIVLRGLLTLSFSDLRYGIAPLLPSSLFPLEEFLFSSLICL